MKSGLLWYDAAPNTTLDKKITDAVNRYREKFGTMPNTAFVNEKDYTPDLAVREVKVTPKRTILPNHVWVGVSEK